jgi:predicted TIM-barrel fold metal-dependent hydrolase
VGVLSPDRETLERIMGADTSRLPAINDVDAHEMMPIHLWSGAFGEPGEIMSELYAGMSHLARRGENSLVIDHSIRDDAPLDVDTVWTVKGPKAPGVIDITRREDVIDVMGFGRQLVFQTFGNTGVVLCYHPQGAEEVFGLEMGGRDPVELGRSIIKAYNQWAGTMTTAFSSDRIRLVGFLLTDSVDQMMADAKEMLANGVKAITISIGTPPAGTSPADEALDPFWALMAEAKIPVVPHLGTEVSLLRSRAWAANVPAFRPSDTSMLEFAVQPYGGATLNLAPDNFLSAMVLGGVFERHPMLRFGVIELGAQWVGPLAERLDLWAGEFERRLTYLTMKPSEYLNRNVRATPYVFEDVKSYFDRYPDLTDVYCYSSDYPHVEGGTYSKQRHALNLAEADQTLIDKFFAENGRWLLP